MAKLEKNELPITEIAPPDIQPQKRVEELFGHFETVSAIPTATPRTFVDQIKFYSGTNTLYFYDTKANVWRTV